MAVKKTKNAVYIVILSIVFACLLAISIVYFKSENRTIPLSLKITSNDVTEIINPWCDDDGKWYFFMPSYSSASNTVLVANGDGCYLQGALLTNEQTISAFNTDTEYHFEQHNLFTDWDTTIVFMKSANVASMYIDTQSGSMKKVHSDKENEEKINLSLWGEDGELLYSEKKYSDEISGHGNSTWEHEKKPYNIKLSEASRLLGMSAAQKWVLLANFADKSSLKNKVVLDFSKEVMSPQWSPAGEYVDLYLNGNYAGLYLLCEKIEASINKVDVGNEGVIFTFAGESQADEDSRLLKSGLWIKIKHSRVTSEKSIDDMAEKIDSIFSLIENYDSDEYLDVVDLDSVAMKYVIEEIFSNYDANSLCFFINNSGQTLFGGPAWDYDLSMGADDETYDAESFYLQKRIFVKLLEHDEFQRAVIRNYIKVRDILAQYINFDISRIEKNIESAREINDIRYHGGDTWHKTINAEEMCLYLAKRMGFLDRIWLEGNQYHTITLTLKTWNGISDRHITVIDGEKINISRLSAYEGEEFVNWYDEDTEQVFEYSEQIIADKHLTAVYSGKNTGNSTDLKDCLTEWILLHKSLVLLAMLCVTFAFVGIIIVFIDVKRNRNGVTDNGNQISS